MDLHLSLDRAAPRPLRDQLYDGLRRAILDGRLPPAARLPAARALAAQLALSRFTVDDAYGRLAAEGYVAGRRGSGTYVAPDLAPAAPPERGAGFPAASPPVPDLAANLAAPPALPAGPDPSRSPAHLLDRPDPVAHRAGPRPLGHPTHVPTRAPRTSASPPASSSAPSGTPPPRPWSAWARRLPPAAVHDDLPSPQPPILFRPGVPALDAFPWPLWNRLRARAGRDASLAARDYGPPAGHPPLRTAVAAYLARSRGIPCGPDQVVITTGTRQAIDLLARLWLEPGDPAAVEDPGYPAARRTLAAAGARLCPVPVDADGLRVDRLPALAPDARLVYVTPSHHYPTGAVLPLARRRALLAWARERGALVLEDDYDGEFRYGARPVPALAGLDATPGVVAYLGTFSKTLYPALRLGFVLLPPDMAERLAAAKAVADHHSPTVDQAALAAFLEEGHFERHLARMRRLYADRRAALLAALAADLPDLVRLHPGLADLPAATRHHPGPADPLAAIRRDPAVAALVAGAGDRRIAADPTLAGHRPAPAAGHPDLSRRDAVLATEPPVVARREPGVAAGLHLLVGFDLPLSEPDLLARAAAAGVGLSPASPCYPTAPPPVPTALLGYAALPEPQIRAGVRALAAALRPTIS